jgi:hypothetical protein
VAPRSPIPRAAPSSPPPPSPAKPQLEGLWADAVKPPPQSAPLEFDGSLRPRGVQPAPRQPLGRAEGLSSIAYTPTEAPAIPSQRTKSSARYWLVAILLLLAVAAAGWFMFGR